jgi:hypothetical protein
MSPHNRRPLQVPGMLILIAASAVAIALLKRHWDVYLPAETPGLAMGGRTGSTAPAGPWASSGC